MYDIIILLALLENKYDITLNQLEYDTCEPTRPLDTGEFQINKCSQQRTEDNFAEERSNCSIVLF